jgi:arabinogalactan oligomer/maltooligosaccharide transport system permease protein
MGGAQASRLAMLYILPSALLMLVITIFPLFYQVFMAFTNYAPQHLRLSLLQAPQAVAWDAGQQVPDTFAATFTQEYVAKNGVEPSRHEIKDAYRQTDEYKAGYGEMLARIGVAENVQRAVLRNPLVFMALRNFGDIFWDSTAFHEFLGPTAANIAEGQSALSYRLQQLTQVLGGELKVSNYNFIRLLSFNIIWTAVNVFFHVVIGVAVAVALNMKDVAGRRFYRVLFVLPYAIPGFVTATVWNAMYDTEFGAINLTIQNINNGLAGLFNQNPATFNPLPEGIRWLESLQAPLGIDLLPLAFYAALFTNIWLGWPFMMLVATGALQSIPGDLYEAATVDGASWLHQFRKITVPLLRPAMIPAIMLGIIWTFNAFNVIYIVTQGKPLGRTEIMVTQAYKLIQEQRLYGVASAFTIVVFFILLIINLWANRVTRATEAADV